MDGRPDFLMYMQAKKVRIKICCISSAAEVGLAVRYGASALGLVSAMPSGPGVVSEDTIARLARIIPPGISSFLLTSKQVGNEIVAQQKACGTNTLQLVDAVPQLEVESVRDQLPGIKIVQVVHVAGEESLLEAETVLPHADALLLDSGNPNLQIKELGGTGRVHNWEISREIVSRSSKPVYLAGGLNPSNVAEAIDIVRPFGVDICSGVRKNGRLDESLLRDFIKSCGY